MSKSLTFSGKAIYNPSGKAGEYSYWACNFFVGCSNGCSYCYLKKGRGAAVLGGDKPTLKKCFRDKVHALEIFKKELNANLPELQKHGLFLSFTTDPCLKETIRLTSSVLNVCNSAFGPQVPVKILTKCTWWVDDFINSNGRIFGIDNPKLIAFAFTLTGHDELEPGASTNAERIQAMKKLHDAGFKTIASIEPVIDFKSSFNMMKQTFGFCDLYKIGLLSGGKFNKNETRFFIRVILAAASQYETKIYFKDSIIQKAGINREDLPANCVGRDYNMFENYRIKNEGNNK